MNFMMIASCTNNLVSRQIIIRFLISQLTSTTSIKHSTNYKWILTPDSRLHRPQPQLATLLLISIRASMHNKFYHLVTCYKFYHLVLSNMQWHKSLNRSTRSITWLLRPRILLMPTKAPLSRTVEVLLSNKYNQHERKQEKLKVNKQLREVDQPQVSSLIQRRKSQLMS